MPATMTITISLSTVGWSPEGNESDSRTLPDVTTINCTVKIWATRVTQRSLVSLPREVAEVVDGEDFGVDVGVADGGNGAVADAGAWDGVGRELHGVGEDVEDGAAVAGDDGEVFGVAVG